MANVPYQHEVVEFVKKLMTLLDGSYEIACEHAHSCSVLAADTKFKVNGQWHTWIDYPRFHELVASGQSFNDMDYIAPTPSWAVYGAPELGFDPEEQRHYRKKKQSAEDESEAQAK
jgi:tRNA wybutosine-synthesizing protein 1